MASYAVYRHNRVIDAILLLGAAMIVNLSATFTNLFGHLLLFVIAALLLWLRAALVDRQDGWQRRRVNENLEVPAAIMRSGIIFAGASVVLAWLLTSVAVAAPLTSAWGSFDGVWTGVRDQFEGVFGTLTNPQSRITGGTFGSSFTVQGEWVSNDQEVLTVAAPRAALPADRDLRRLHRPRLGTQRGPDAAGGARRSALHRRRRPSARARPTRSRRSRSACTRRSDATCSRPASPLAVFAPIVIHESAGQPVLGGIEAANPIGSGEGYQLAVALSTATEAQLAAAGTDYPQVVRDLYFDDSRATDRVAQLAQDVVDAAGAQNPYDQAKALAAYLQRDDSFTYDDRRPPRPEGGQDLVDFFLFDPVSDGRGTASTTPARW